jgi:alkanesulfonate monooxygenase SsuD/methylene tetrahydromethanopterin reductase-like flavin-dependent oxidoreductase (luciferase family)
MDVSSPATDALATVAGLARDTDRIRLTVLVSPVTFRHPALLAKTAGTLAEMSGDRFELGVGTGWMQSEHDAFGIALPPIGERFDRFEEALGYLWVAFGRQKSGFAGDHFALADITVRPEVGGRVPLVVGGKGRRRTPTLAGRYADEFNVFATDRDTLGRRLDVMRGAAVDAGRDPDDIKVSMMLTPVVGDEEAEYRDRLGQAAAADGIGADELEADLRDRHVPHGTADRVASMFSEIASWGVQRIYLQQFAALDAIDLAREARTHRLLRGV